MAADQHAGVLMLRIGEQRALFTLLHQLPVAHDSDPVAGLRYDAQIVGNQDHRQSEPIAQFEQKIEYLRLNGHVERGRRLVGNQDFRSTGQGRRDHRALAHTARKLVRVTVILPLGIGKADLFEDVDGCGPGPFLCRALMKANAFGDLLADLHDGIEMARRVLEDHADLAAANLQHLGTVNACEILPVEHDAAGIDLQRA